MPVDLAATELVAQLERVGLRPPERLAQQIIRSGPAAAGPLIALATDIEKLHGDEPHCFGPLHALRLLGEVRPSEMIAPLVAQYPIPLEHPDEELPRLWATEAPQIIARLGASAMDALWATADDPAVHPVGRGVALHALTYLTAYAPETHDQVVAGLRERLRAYDDPKLLAMLILALGNLSDAESYGEVMALYRAGRVDREALPPGTARQMLLTPSHQRLRCVNHPLWERYDEHGPRPSAE
jgi:hypothetical protein